MRSEHRSRAVPKKPLASVIAIDSVRSGSDDLPPTPQAVAPKRKFMGNGPTNRSVLAMHKQWVWKVARFYRVPPALIEERIVEAIHERRAA